MEVGTSSQTSLLHSKESSDPIKPTLFFVSANINSSQRIFLHRVLVLLCLKKDSLLMNSRREDCCLPLLASPASLDMTSKQLHWKHFFFFLHRNIYKPFNMQFLKGRSKKASKISLSLSTKESEFTVFLIGWCCENSTKTTIHKIPVSGTINIYKSFVIVFFFDMSF